MPTGSKLSATSGPTHGQTPSSASIVAESLSDQEPLKNRESPNGRSQWQETEPKTAPSTGSGGTDRACWGLNGGDRRFLTVVSAVALLLMAVHWFRITQWSPVPVGVDRPAGENYRFVLDANRATWVEWMQLEGIGETLARRIVEDRAQNGPFPDVDALDRVPGIGPKTLERMRSRVIVSEQKIAVDITD